VIRAFASDRTTPVALALLGGKWAAATVARILSHVASGGVAQWFLHQDALLQELRQQTTANTTASSPDDKNGNDMELYDDFDPNSTDAYHSADASVYRPVLASDEDDALDDDYDDVDDEAPVRRNDTGRGTRSRHSAPARHTAMNAASNVKPLLVSAVSVSFGSVAQCGLVGGPAQFVWSQVRKVEIARSVWMQARLAGGNGAVTSAAMVVGGGGIGSVRRMTVVNSGEDTTVVAKTWNYVNQRARDFVRKYSDLGMSHVAVYYKSYQKAARDVSTLIEQTGVEPILHDDITTHMCSCVGGSISGIIVLFTGHVLLRQRASAGQHDISDLQVVEVMVLAYVLSYTLIFTVLEPLRSSVKAIYVSFAQHPESLRHTFPLVYHRLCRLSGSNS
jgi:hypothetical protein